MRRRSKASPLGDGSAASSITMLAHVRSQDNLRRQIRRAQVRARVQSGAEGQPSAPRGTARRVKRRDQS